MLAPAATLSGNVGAGEKEKLAGWLPPKVHPVKVTVPVLPADAAIVTLWVAMGSPTAPWKVKEGGVGVCKLNCVSAL